MSSETQKSFYHSDMLVFQGLYDSLKDLGKNNWLFRALAWICSWIFSTDHKRVCMLYLVFMLIFFAVGAALGGIIRLEWMWPGTQFVSAQIYNSVFTLHGVIMIFMFVIPGIPATFGNFFLPILLGGPDVSFPRLNLASWYFFIIGATLAFMSLFLGIGEVGVDWSAPDGGWTFYVPYSVQNQANISMALLAAFILGFSSIFTGINFVATVHRMRSPKMGWFQMPLFCWAIYATAWIQVIATPVVGITLALVVVERAFGVGIFDAALGGDPVLYQHMFWIYSHPAVYIMVVPGMGLISEVIAVFSQRTIFGYKAIAGSSFGIAVIGYFVWAHHMFTAGMTETAAITFSFITFLVGVPTAIKIFNWLATLYKGSIKLDPPMIWALSFVFLFSIGGFTGLMLGAIGADLHVHDTLYVVGHFHYTMFGGGGVAFFCGLHYWFPKMFGRMYNFTAANIGWLLFFVGFNVHYGSMLYIGIAGMPRRYHDYLPQFTDAHQIGSIAAFIMLAGIVVFMTNLIIALFKGEKATDNPWKGKTLEWEETSTPPILLNFEKEPELAHGPYAYEGEWVK